MLAKIRGPLLSLLAASTWLLPGAAEADVPLETAEDVFRVCEEARRASYRELYVIRIESDGWEYAPYSESDRFLPVDLSRNLRAFGGRVELFPSRLEPMGFVAGSERAAALLEMKPGSVLRIGFFLGFDNPRRTSCLVRPHGTTAVRADLAFIELVRQRDVLAREDTERLRAWLDDAALDAVPGEGPRGAMGVAVRTAGGGGTPSTWQRAITLANQGELGREFSRCHTQGIARGGAARGQVVLRLQVAANAGVIDGVEVELSSMGEPSTASCAVEAVRRHLQLPPAPQLGTRVAISIPIRFLN